MAFDGVEAPALTSQLSIVLLSLPVMLPVLKTIRPLVRVVLTPCTTQYLIVLLDASLMNCMTEPPVFKLESVRLLVVPVRPIRPSMVTLSASFRLMIGSARLPLMVLVPVG